MTGDEYYTLEDQLVVIRRQLGELADRVAELVEKVRLLRYDLDMAERRRS